MNNVVPFLSFNGQPTLLKQKIFRAFERVLESKQYILGPELISFEQAYAKFSGVKYAAGLGNGFDALQLSLKALNIGRGHEVIAPSNTCVPTWMAIEATGAKIVPVEPSIQSYNLDPNKIADAITSRTRAIVPVHLYGQACEMSEITKIARRHNLVIVEDNAQAHGAEHRGKKTGSFGIINATSFYPTKNLGAIGDAGAITTNDRKLFEKVVAMRNYGSVKKNLNTEIGINSRMDELHAAVLLEKLNYLDKFNSDRKRLAEYYLKSLKSTGDIQLPVTVDNCTHAYHLFVVRTNYRDKLRDHLTRRKVGTMIHYPVPPHLQAAFRRYRFRKGNFPIAEMISDTSLSLPLWPGMKKIEVDYVVDSITSFYR